MATAISGIYEQNQPVWDLGDLYRPTANEEFMNPSQPLPSHK